MNSEAGQSMIEFLIVLKLIVFILGFCFVLTLVGFTKSYLQHVAYQALICTNTDQLSAQSCRTTTKKALKILPFGQLLKFKFNKQVVSLSWQLNIYKWPIELSTSQRLTIEDWL